MTLRLPSSALRTRLSACEPGLVIALAAAFLAGCAGDQDTSSGDSMASSSATGTRSVARSTGDGGYLVGPRDARQFGYRIDWQFPGNGEPAAHIRVEDDSVLLLEDDNVLVRIRREDGNRVWSLPIASPVDEIQGLNYIPDDERIYVSAGSSLLELDSGTGSQVGRQRLERVINTQPVRIGQFLVYGSRDGMIVYHAFRLDSDWRKYQIGPSIQVAPAYSNGYLIAVASDGSIMNLLAGSVTRVWRHRTLEPIVSAPAVGNGIAFVASLDQHLRAYLLDEDRTPIWQYLTESPLRDGPTLVGDVVYQQVPGRGLVCLEADPQDAPGGSALWWADTSGSVLTRIGDDLVCWDPDAHRLDLVEARLGAVIDSLDLPGVESIHVTTVNGGDLFVIGTDGSVLRLVPRR